MQFSILARIVAMLAIAALIAGGLWKVRHSGIADGRAEVQAQWDADKAARMQAALLAAEAARQREHDLQQAADKLRRAKDAEILDLGVRVGELRKRLQDRPDRPASSPAVAASGARPGGPGCTGAQLYRADSEFLVWLASEADKLRFSLKSCQSAYNAARNAINGLTPAAP